MEGNLKILFVEDVKADAELIWRELDKYKIAFNKLLVDNENDFIEGLKSFKPDLIISDYTLPRLNGMQTLLLRNKYSPMTPFIIVTGSVNETVAVECMKAGADDYILKDNLSRLGLSVINSLNKANILREKNIAEAALHKSEAIFSHFMENSPIYVFFKDEKIRPILLSNNYESMLGKPISELLGKSMDELFPSDLAKSMVQDDLRILKEGKVITVDEELNGRYYTTIKFPIIIDGKPSFLAGYTIDITDRKLADEALVESEMKYRQLVTRSPDGIFIVDLSGKFLSVNSTICNNLKYSEEELLSMKIWDIIPAKYQAMQRQRLNAVIYGEGTNPAAEYEVLGKDGTSYPVEVLSVPYFKGKEIIGFQGIARDTRERRQAEEALQHNLDFSESLLKTIPFGMDIVDETGTVLFQSENFKELFGEDAIGNKCWHLYRDDKKQCFDCPLAKGIKVGETESYESHGVMGGRIFEINHTGMMYKGKRAMLEIFQDITQRKIDEAELISAKNKAEESDNLKTAFLHNISHEIRTPMNAIIGFSSLLSDPAIENQERQSYIEMLLQGSDHLLSIITDIVDISNIEANLVKTSKNEINVNSVLKSLYSQFLPKANEKKIRFYSKNGLPDEEALIITDSTKLNQILSNLLSNALKFTDKGSVEMEYKKDGLYLRFCVTDTGIGIRQEYHKRVFDRFYQVENSDARTYEGTGLGLAISNAYVELLGGKMGLTSEPGKGSSFYFTLPYHKQVATSLPEVVKPEIADFEFTRKMKILVAEDIESNFRLIRYFLSGANTELIRVKTGKEAVDMCLSDKSIDIVLMDVKMPEMDGYTAAKKIREANIGIPIIAQTAYADDKDKAVESGCSGFIAKPFDKMGLLSKICEFI